MLRLKVQHQGRIFHCVWDTSLAYADALSAFWEDLRRALRLQVNVEYTVHLQESGDVIMERALASLEPLTLLTVSPVQLQQQPQQQQTAVIELLDSSSSDEDQNAPTGQRDKTAPRSQAATSKTGHASAARRATPTLSSTSASPREPHHPVASSSRTTLDGVRDSPEIGLDDSSPEPATRKSSIKRSASSADVVIPTFGKPYSKLERLPRGRQDDLELVISRKMHSCLATIAFKESSDGSKHSLYPPDVRVSWGKVRWQNPIEAQWNRSSWELADLHVFGQAATVAEARVALIEQHGINAERVLNLYFTASASVLSEDSRLDHLPAPKELEIIKHTPVRTPTSPLDPSCFYVTIHPAGNQRPLSVLTSSKDPGLSLWDRYFEAFGQTDAKPQTHIMIARQRPVHPALPLARSGLSQSLRPHEREITVLERKRLTISVHLPNSGEIVYFQVYPDITWKGLRGLLEADYEVFDLDFGWTLANASLPTHWLSEQPKTAHDLAVFALVPLLERREDRSYATVRQLWSRNRGTGRVTDGRRALASK